MMSDARLYRKATLRSQMARTKNPAAVSAVQLVGTQERGPAASARNRRDRAERDIEIDVPDRSHGSTASPWNSCHSFSSSRRICEMRPGLTRNLRAVRLVVRRRQRRRDPAFASGQAVEPGRDVDARRSGCSGTGLPVFEQNLLPFAVSSSKTSNRSTVIRLWA